MEDTSEWEGLNGPCMHKHSVARKVKELVPSLIPSPLSWRFFEMRWSEIASEALLGDNCH